MSMIVKEENKFTTHHSHWPTHYHSIQPNDSLVTQTKIIKYDSDPTYEIQEMVDDGWNIEKIEVSHYYDYTAMHTVTMSRGTMNLPQAEIVIETATPSPEELHQQISKLFDKKWDI